MSFSSRPLRLAAIDFLNPAPLMWDFEHEPERSHLAQRYEIRYSTPSRCAEDLFTGFADIGLVPAAAYSIDPRLLIVPGCTIASKGHIRSILLVTRESGPEAAKTVAMDTSSLTSAAYTEILFRKYWNPAAEFLRVAPRLDAMLEAADAALLIGDPALLALEDREPRFERTGVPWVSAFWAARPSASEAASISPEAITADFINSRDHGLAHIEDLVNEWSHVRPSTSAREKRSHIALPKETIRAYLTENIHYVLDEACIEGLKTFYRYAAEYSVLPAAPELRFL